MLQTSHLHPPFDLRFALRQRPNFVSVNSLVFVLLWEGGGLYICCLSFGRAQENLRNGGVHMLPNFWSRTGKIEEGDVSISYLDFGQVQEKLRK